MPGRTPPNSKSFKSPRRISEWMRKGNGSPPDKGGSGGRLWAGGSKDFDEAAPPVKGYAAGTPDPWAPAKVPAGAPAKTAPGAKASEYSAKWKAKSTPFKSDAKNIPNPKAPVKTRPDATDDSPVKKWATKKVKGFAEGTGSGTKPPAKLTGTSVWGKGPQNAVKLRQLAQQKKDKPGFASGTAFGKGAGNAAAMRAKAEAKKHPEPKKATSHWVQGNTNSKGPVPESSFPKYGEK